MPVLVDLICCVLVSYQSLLLSQHTANVVLNTFRRKKSSCTAWIDHGC